MQKDSKKATLMANTDIGCKNKQNMSQIYRNAGKSVKLT